jgi:4-hydroxy-tetrahydrodipicolinate synthase
MNLQGVGTALVTPFTKEDLVDYEGLRRNTQYQLKEGVNFLLYLGTTGETPTLNRDEQECKGKVPVMVGTGTNSTYTTITNTQRGQELGGDVALVVTPYYNKPTQEGIFEHYKQLMRNIDIPVVVYNIKGRCGVNIETNTLENIAQIDGIVGVKEASGDINQVGDVIYRIKNNDSGFQVLSGDDALTFPVMALGGDGVISVVSNLVPRRVVEMVTHCHEGQFKSAREKHHTLLPLMNKAFIESNPQPIKYMMELVGMPAGHCRGPLTELRSDSETELERLVSKLQDDGFFK